MTYGILGRLNLSPVDSTKLDIGDKFASLSQLESIYKFKKVT